MLIRFYKPSSKEFDSLIEDEIHDVVRYNFY